MNQDSARPGSFRRHRPQLRGWMVVVVSACLLLPELGAPVARREQEMRVLLTARDMYWSGRWLVPHYKNEVRLRKPPLMYWLVGALYRLGAPVDSAMWGRLPSALAGISFVTALYLFGRRLVGRRRAATAAFVAMVSVAFLRQGRLAETDMTLSLFVLLTALAGARALLGSPRWWILAGACAGLGFLVKGPAAVTLPPAAWCAYAWWRRGRLQSPLRRPAFWFGLILCISIAAPWYAMVNRLQEAATDVQLEAEVGALLSTSKHTGPFFYYVYTSVFALAPWGLLLPPALLLAFRLGCGRAGWSFPLMWFASTFLILSALSSKQMHYALLLVAPGSLLIACALHARRAWMRRWGERVARSLLLIALLLCLIVPVALALRAPPLSAANLALCLLAAGWICIAFRRQAAAAALPVFAIALGAILPGAVRLSAVADPHGEASRAVTLRALAAAPPGAPIICLGPLNTTCAFYSDRPVSYAPSFDCAWTSAVSGTLILATWKSAEQPDLAALSPAILAAGGEQAEFVAALLKP